MNTHTRPCTHPVCTGRMPYNYRKAAPSQVVTVGWWMMHYGAPSPKRSKGWSNNPAVLELDRGRLARSAMEASQTTLARHYRDKNGCWRWVGLTKSMKQSASYPELIIMLKRPSQTLPGSSLLWLRCYPLRFGMAIRDLLHKLMTRGRGKPEDVPGYCGASDVGSTNINLPGEDWEDADLRPVIKYLRGCTFLQLPPLWKEAFPKAI